MSKNTTGWVIFAAAIGMMCTLLSAEVTSLTTWAQAITPGFVGKAMAHVGVVVGAFIGGKLLPSSPD